MGPDRALRLALTIPESCSVEFLNVHLEYGSRNEYHFVHLCTHTLAAPSCLLVILERLLCCKITLRQLSLPTCMELLQGQAHASAASTGSCLRSRSHLSGSLLFIFPQVFSLNSRLVRSPCSTGPKYIGEAVRHISRPACREGARNMKRCATHKCDSLTASHLVRISFCRLLELR